MNDYPIFLNSKRHTNNPSGFDPLWMPDFLFDFQSYIANWAIQKGRCAIYLDCGMGKTPIELVFARNSYLKTGKPSLIMTPLAVATQHVKEARKFGIDAEVSKGGKTDSPIVITNYEKLQHFNSDDYGAVICDESAILKNFDGKTRALITEFMRRIKYRLLATATPAPNDYIEFGTSSEALGEMGYMDMLSRFFKNDQNSNHPNRIWSGGKWRFRGHAEEHFWRWVCSWAKAMRSPSDAGFENKDFVLPELSMRQHVIHANKKADGYLLDLPAHTLAEQRDERRRTIKERCEKTAELMNAHKGASVAWCNLNDEGDLLEKLLPKAIQVSGKDSDEKKEEALSAFASGEITQMITKCEIAGWGLNWQHCSHQSFFPSHSFEQFYQAVRRSWRFGQKNPVLVDVVTSEGESKVLSNLQRKTKASEVMFLRLVQFMNQELKIEKPEISKFKPSSPLWMTTK